MNCKKTWFYWHWRSSNGHWRTYIDIEIYKKKQDLLISPSVAISIFKCLHIQIDFFASPNDYSVMHIISYIWKINKGNIPEFVESSILVKRKSLKKFKCPSFNLKRRPIHHRGYIDLHKIIIVSFEVMTGLKTHIFRSGLHEYTVQVRIMSIFLNRKHLVV